MRLLLLLLVALPLAAGPADSFLLRGVTVHPVTGADVANCALLVLDGAIAEFGPALKAPKNVPVIDARGLHVYPGMIDSGTEMGLQEIGSVRETVDTTEIGDYNPQLRAVIAVNPASEHIPVTRANGITTVLTIPEGGVISGQAALIHLDGWTWEEMQVSRSAALHLRFPVPGPTARSFFEPPARTPFEEIRKQHDERLRNLHEFFEQARRYQRAKAAGGSGFRADLKLEAMLPVIEGKLSVLVSAARKRAIREALEFAAREKFRIVLAQVEEPGEMLAQIKERGIPVILGPTLTLPVEEDSPYDGAFTLPAELHKAGIKFAFGTFRTSASRNLPYQAAAAVAFGLPYEEALKAVTINPAEIFGVADKIGSIAKGKWADLVVTDGDPLETRTQVKRVFIRGKSVSLDNKHLRLYKTYIERP